MLEMNKIEAVRPIEELCEEEQMKLQELCWNEERKRQGLPTSEELVKKLRYTYIKHKGQHFIRECLTTLLFCCIVFLENAQNTGKSLE